MARILIVSRKRAEGRSFARLLARDGHRARLGVSDEAAARLVTDEKPDLVVLTVPDPASTLRVLVRQAGSQVRRTPTLTILPEESAVSAQDEDSPGLVDVLASPFTEDELLARVDALLRVVEVLTGRGTGLAASSASAKENRRGARAWLAKIPLLGRGFGRLRGATHRANAGARRARSRAAYLDAAVSLVGSVEGRDAIDRGHGDRVSHYCSLIASAVGMPEDEIELLLRAAEIHDIGKIAWPTELLRKPKLTETDRRVVRTHPRRSAALIRALTPFGGAADMVQYHHEQPDGNGYYGLPREQLPLGALILAVADAFDGMTTSHTGRDPLSPEAAFELLRAGGGTKYDGDCVDALEASARPRRSTIRVSEPPRLPDWDL